MVQTSRPLEKGEDLTEWKSTFRMSDDPQLIYGKRAIEEAFVAQKRFERLFLQRDLRGDFVNDLRNKARETQTAVTLVPVEKLNRLTRRNHQGVVGFLSLIEYSSLHHIVAACFDKGKNPLIIILDEITDVRNIGSIARSAECAGVDAIVLPSKGGAQINSDAMKTSAGALNHIPVCKEVNLYDTCKYLQNSGLQLLACSEKGDKKYYEVDMRPPMAIIMGSENTGISNQLLKIADAEVKIEMRGRIKSLNVANATSVLLFEANRQRFS